jgi:spore germination cell wall hydrolase CwlJ-like protein
MTPDDLLREFMLALCCYREARGESPLGKALVCQTILNRTRDLKKRWPRTIQGVVCQPLQFSSFNRNDPNVTVYPTEGEPAWIECVGASQRALAADPPLTTANHYLTTSLFKSKLKPLWADPSKVLITEGHHVFLEL